MQAKDSVEETLLTRCTELLLS